MSEDFGAPPDGFGAPPDGFGGSGDEFGARAQKAAGYGDELIGDAANVALAIGVAGTITINMVSPGRMPYVYTRDLVISPWITATGVAVPCAGRITGLVVGVQPFMAGGVSTEVFSATNQRRPQIRKRLQVGVDNLLVNVTNGPVAVTYNGALYGADGQK